MQLTYFINSFSLPKNNFFFSHCYKFPLWWLNVQNGLEISFIIPNIEHKEWVIGKQIKNVVLFQNREIHLS